MNQFPQDPRQQVDIWQPQEQTELFYDQTISEIPFTVMQYLFTPRDNHPIDFSDENEQLPLQLKLSVIQTIKQHRQVQKHAAKSSCQRQKTKKKIQTSLKPQQKIQRCVQLVQEPEIRSYESLRAPLKNMKASHLLESLSHTKQEYHKTKLQAKDIITKLIKQRQVQPKFPSIVSVSTQVVNKNKQLNKSVQVVIGSLSNNKNKSKPELRPRTLIMGVDPVQASIQICKGCQIIFENGKSMKKQQDQPSVKAKSFFQHKIPIVQKAMSSQDNFFKGFFKKKSLSKLPKLGVNKISVSQLLQDLIKTQNNPAQLQQKREQSKSNNLNQSQSFAQQFYTGNLVYRKQSFDKMVIHKKPLKKLNYAKI